MLMLSSCKLLLVIIRIVDIFFFKNVFPCLDLYSGGGRCQIQVIKQLYKPEEKWVFDLVAPFTVWEKNALQSHCDSKPMLVGTSLYNSLCSL